MKIFDIVFNTKNTKVQNLLISRTRHNNSFIRMMISDVLGMKNDSNAEACDQTIKTFKEFGIKDGEEFIVLVWW